MINILKEPKLRSNLPRTVNIRNNRTQGKRKVPRLKGKKPEKAQTFVWEPIEGFNLEPRFSTWTLFKPK
jgi:hypothetical protein